MTSTTHRADIFERGLPRVLVHRRLRLKPTLAQGLAPLAALGVLVLLLDGHGLSWLAGLVAGASASAWVVTLRRPPVVAPAAPVGNGDADTRAQLSLLGDAGWHAVHDLEARFGHYQHIAVGPGGVVSLHSQQLTRPRDIADPASERELLLLRRGALTAAANLRDEIDHATGQPCWVQAVVVVWSDFPAGCVQDGRCVFVSGARLNDWLRRRPGQLSPQRGDAIRGALERLAVPIAA